MIDQVEKSSGLKATAVSKPSGRLALLVATLAMACMLSGLMTGCTSGDAQRNVLSFDEGQAQADGTFLFVRLSSNPTTGYDWAYEIDGSGMELDGQEYVEGVEPDGKGETTTYDENGSSSTGTDEGGEAILGQGGTLAYRFCGTGEGEQTLTFIFRRDWEISDDDITVTLKATTDADGKVASITWIGSDGSAKSLSVE